MSAPFDSYSDVAGETERNSAPKRNKGGRPRGATKLKLTDALVKQIESLARIQCTQKEAGAVLGVNEVTFSSFLQRHEKAREAWENGKETGKASLRRQQFKMAESNPSMAIWLGKQVLGQRDVMDMNHNLKLSDEFEAFLKDMRAQKEQKILTVEAVPVAIENERSSGSQEIPTGHFRSPTE